MKTQDNLFYSTLPAVISSWSVHSVSFIAFQNDVSVRVFHPSTSRDCCRSPAVCVPEALWRDTLVAWSYTTLSLASSRNRRGSINLKDNEVQNDTRNLRFVITARTRLVWPAFLFGRPWLFAFVGGCLSLPRVPLSFYLSNCLNGFSSAVRVFSPRVPRIGIVAIFIHKPSPAVLLAFFNSQLCRAMCKHTLVLFFHWAQRSKILVPMVA